MSIKTLFILDPDAFDAIYGADFVERLTGRADLLAPPLSASEVAAHPELIRDVEVIFSGWGAPLLDEAFLISSPRLRAVFYGAGSVRYFTTDEFWKRGIELTSAHAINALPVAEFTAAAIMLSLKHVWRHVLQIKRDGRFGKLDWMPGGYGSKVGLISLGLIGRMTAERLKSHEVEVLAWDPRLDADMARELAVRPASVECIFEQCDVVSLHAPLLAETKEWIGARHFERMKPGATFINTARGAIVREDELIEVFSRRSDLTAVLDVTSPEPPVAGSPLYHLPNIVLTPHLAGSRFEECRRMGRLMLDEFDRWKRGEPMQFSITREKALQTT